MRNWREQKKHDLVVFVMHTDVFPSCGGEDDVCLHRPFLIGVGLKGPAIESTSTPWKIRRVVFGSGFMLTPHPNETSTVLSLLLRRPLSAAPLPGTFVFTWSTSQGTCSYLWLSRLAAECAAPVNFLLFFFHCDLPQHPNWTVESLWPPPPPPIPYLPIMSNFIVDHHVL